jgi:hypothetical protein
MTYGRGLIGALYAGVVALIVVNVLPALINLIAINLKWDERALGLLASATSPEPLSAPGYGSVQFLGVVGVLFALVSLLPLRLHVRKAAT